MGVNVDTILERPRRIRSAELRANEFRRLTGRPLKRLSSIATLQREAEAEASHTFAGRPITPPLGYNDHLEGNQWLLSHSRVSAGSTNSVRSRSASKAQYTSRSKAILEVSISHIRLQNVLKLSFTGQHYEVFRAIDMKDLDLLGEIRDRAFHLLLERQPGGQTPMLYAMQHGKSHQEIVLFLVGAISQWINRLNDDDFSKPFTMTLLRFARSNLKSAIDKGVAKLQTDLIASFLQTLVMCEGNQWIRDQVSNVAFALTAGAKGKPVNVASSAVRRFCTDSLLGADLIADVED
ncbi:hypothetical protein H0H87_000379 [Tephrocybe sp. NHM501043]|nr:hypothetical protein H0H87_000379 [Tephrocybe sp. NHM501043]